MAVSKVGKKRPKKQYVICLANYRYCALGVAWCFVFLAFGVSANYPQAVCKGWMEYATPALQVVIVPYLLGSTRELGTV